MGNFDVFCEILMFFVKFCGFLKFKAKCADVFVRFDRFFEEYEWFEIKFECKKARLK